jgi:hypothetical protein
VKLVLLEMGEFFEHRLLLFNGHTHTRVNHLETKPTDHLLMTHNSVLIERSDYQNLIQYTQHTHVYSIPKIIMPVIRYNKYVLNLLTLSDSATASSQVLRGRQVIFTITVPFAGVNFNFNINFINQYDMFFRIRVKHTALEIKFLTTWSILMVSM